MSGFTIYPSTSFETKVANSTNKPWQTLAFSVQDNNARSFFGRGFGYSGAAFCGRHLFVQSATIYRLLLYLDTESYQSWSANPTQQLCLNIWKEYPAAGIAGSGGVGSNFNGVSNGPVPKIFSLPKPRSSFALFL